MKHLCSFNNWIQYCVPTHHLFRTIEVRECLWCGSKQYRLFGKIPVYLWRNPRGQEQLDRHLPGKYRYNL